MLLLAILIILPLTVPSVSSNPCGLIDKTKCGCSFASLTVSNATMKFGWLPSQNNTMIDNDRRQSFNTIIASDVGGIRYNLWPGGILFYVIDSAFSSNYLSLIRKTIAETQATIGVKYVELVEAKTSSGTICRKNYVHIQPLDKPGCIAQLGMDRNGITFLKLNETYCKDAYAIIHELLHALGRNHEHTRRDRETHLQLNYDNIFTPVCQEFQKPVFFDSTDSLAYDYDSIMHYGSCAGSCNGGYVYTKKDGSPIGINNKLTDLDVKKIRHMYPAEQKVKYIAKRLCLGPDKPIESVESLGEILRRRNGTIDEDEDDNNHSTGYRISNCGPLMLLLVSVKMLANLFFVLH